MALKIGNKSLLLVKFGDELVNSIYIGNNLIYNHGIKLYGWQVGGLTSGNTELQRVYTTNPNVLNESTIFYDKWGIAFSHSKNEGGCAIWENDSLTVTAFDGTSYTILKTGLSLTRVESDEVVITDNSIQLYRYRDGKLYTETDCFLIIDAYKDGFSGNVYLPFNTANTTIIRPHFTKLSVTVSGDTTTYWNISYALTAENQITDGWGIPFERYTSGEDPIYYYKFQ